MLGLMVVQISAEFGPCNNCMCASVVITVTSSKPPSVLLGDYISLNCSTSPPTSEDLSFTWTHLMINSSAVLLEETSNILTFPHISLQELGTYQCSGGSFLAANGGAQVTITNKIPLIQAGEYPGKITNGACPSQQTLEDIIVDVLQLLSSEYDVRPLGLTRSYPAKSCDQVAEANPGSPSGKYWLSYAGSEVQIYCQF